MELKKSNFEVYGRLYHDRTLEIVINGISSTYNADEVLGVVAKLSELQTKLTNALLEDRIKNINKVKDKS